MVGIAANANHGHGAEVEAMLNGFAKEGARRIRSAAQVEEFCTEVAEWSFAFGDFVRACSGKWGVAPATAAPYSPGGNNSSAVSEAVAAGILRRLPGRFSEAPYRQLKAARRQRRAEPEAAHQRGLPISMLLRLRVLLPWRSSCGASVGVRVPVCAGGGVLAKAPRQLDESAWRIWLRR